MFDRSIKLLNKAVADELAAVHQYMYFHFHCADQGLDLFSDMFKKTAITEMQHAEKLSERILFLKGDIDMVVSGPVIKTPEIKDMLEIARKMEQDSVKEYNVWVNECAQNNDSVSKQLFEALIIDEESHYNQFDNELMNIEKFGSSYLALQSVERSKKVVS